MSVIRSAWVPRRHVDERSSTRGDDRYSEVETDRGATSTWSATARTRHHSPVDDHASWASDSQPRPDRSGCTDVAVVSELRPQALGVHRAAPHPVDSCPSEPRRGRTVPGSEGHLDVRATSPTSRRSMNVSNGQDTPTTVIRMDGGVGGVVAELTAGPDAGSRKWDNRRMLVWNRTPPSAGTLRLPDRPGSR